MENERKLAIDIVYIVEEVLAKNGIIAPLKGSNESPRKAEIHEKTYFELEDRIAEHLKDNNYVVEILYECPQCGDNLDMQITSDIVTIQENPNNKGNIRKQGCPICGRPQMNVQEVRVV